MEISRVRFEKKFEIKPTVKMGVSPTIEFDSSSVDVISIVLAGPVDHWCSHEIHVDQ